MDRDDPDALQALIDYLHRPKDTIKHVENWKISYEYGNSLEDEKDRCCHRFRGTTFNGHPCGDLPREYLPYLANVLTVAERFGQPLFEKAVTSMFELPDTEKAFQVCPGCQTSGKMYDVKSARESELLKAYTNNPVEVVKAFTILNRLPDSCKVRERAKAHVMDFFDDPDFMKHFELDGDDPTRLEANTYSRQGVEIVIAEAPEIFFSLVKRYKEVSETNASVRIENRQLQAEIDDLKAQLANRALHGDSDSDHLLYDGV